MAPNTEIEGKRGYVTMTGRFGGRAAATGYGRFLPVVTNVT
jgi:hypothetical protein